MIRLILGLLFVAFLTTPSSAVIRQLVAHPGADDLKAACGGGEFSWSADGDGYTCVKKNCDGKGGTCTVSCDEAANCQGSTPSREVQVGTLIGPNTFDSSLAPPEQFGLKHVTRQQLLSACGSVRHAMFGGTKEQYFCGNPKCDPGIGPCYIECDLSKCTAGMPKKPLGGMTLVAILQGGKGVLHGGQLDEGSTTKGGTPAAPAAPPPPPVIIIP